MSILIKGMSMPKNCKDCPLLGTALNCRILEVAVDGDYYNPDARHEDCPLVELPPHGRLIDADALMDKFRNADANGINLVIDRYALKSIADAPTIMESEGEDAKRK